jgi:low temperature requirement protein LtrA
MTVDQEQKEQTTVALNRWRRPRLRVVSDAENVGHASWIELFFDLVFVIVIAELSSTLEKNLDIISFLKFAALFVPCWWGWVLFTFYADRYDTDDVIHRLLILSGMLAVIFLAGNIHNAFGSGAVGFALSYIAIRTIILGLYMRAVRHVSVAQASLNLYLTSYIPSTALWVISIAAPTPTRYFCWLVAMLIELSVPILGSKMFANTPVHPSHLPERFGLLTLIVLGEAIVSVASGTTNTNWALIPTVAAVGGFALAACLWWLYFNFLERAVIIRGIRSVHIYNYGHLPIIMGISLVAVGTKHTIHEASHAFLSTGARWALCGGVGLYLLSIGTILVLGCRRRLTWLLIVSIATSFSLAIFGGSLPPLIVLGLLVTVLVIKIVWDILHFKPTTTLTTEQEINS